MQVLMVLPEPPYPLNGGGAYRTASLLHYFARFADVDLMLFSEANEPPVLPAGLARSQQVIPLPRHSKTTSAKYSRNAKRAIRGVPPLIDRLAGFESEIESAIGNRRYDVSVIEHFWCAPYIGVLEKHCTKTLLDLHNVESVLHQACAGLRSVRSDGLFHSVGEQLMRAGHRRFAAASRRMESDLLPRFSCVLTTSEDDARLVRHIAPAATVQVYPNALPCTDVPIEPEEPVLVFPANFEYHPNIDAVAFLIAEIWPSIRQRHPDFRLRLVGRGDSFIRHLLPKGTPEETGIEVTGPVEDARREIAKATIVVAPLRAGSGTRIKILEAWAARRAIVATPMAAEGLEAQDGANIGLASASNDFVERVSQLILDPPLRQRLAYAGRRTFEDNYSWGAAWRRLDFDLQLT